MNVIQTLPLQFFGVLWNWFLLGTLLVQICEYNECVVIHLTRSLLDNYYLDFKKDSKWMKAFGKFSDTLHKCSPNMAC